MKASIAPGPPPMKSEAALRVAIPLLEEPVADRRNWTIPRLRAEIEARKGVCISRSTVQGLAKKVPLAAASAHAELPCVGPEPHHCRHRSLEHGLSRPRSPPVTRAGSDGSRRSAGPRGPARMGAHRSDRRLRLDRGEPRRAVSAATRGSFYVQGRLPRGYGLKRLIDLPFGVAQFFIRSDPIGVLGQCWRAAAGASPRSAPIGSRLARLIPLRGRQETKSAPERASRYCGRGRRGPIRRRPANPPCRPRKALASASASPSRGPGNGILWAETGGRFQAQNAGERPEFGSQTATRLPNRPELRGFLSTRKPRRFAGTAWWEVGLEPTKA